MADVRAALEADDETLQSHPDLGFYLESLSELYGGRIPSDAADKSKGAMIIGTFRKIPLADRYNNGEVDFPDQVLRASARQGTCVATGLDILCLVLQVRAGLLTAEEARSRIKSANGRLDAGNWADVLRTVGSVGR